MKTLLLATANAHKAAEMRAILTLSLPPEVDIVTLADLSIPAAPSDIEDGRTFTANARAKARWYAAASGLPCIAGDSGLCVDSLAGAPGVRSARWAGPTDADRNQALLAAMSAAGALEIADRSARFVCSCALSMPDALTLSALGTLAGYILREPSGGSGFGYDPFFYVSSLGLTLAQAGSELKNAISHRSVALRRLSALQEVFA